MLFSAKVDVRFDHQLETIRSKADGNDSKGKDEGVAAGEAGTDRVQGAAGASQGKGWISYTFTATTSPYVPYRLMT